MGESMTSALGRGASVTVHRTEPPDEAAVEVLARWLLWWSEHATPPFGHLAEIHGDDEEGIARCLAQALCAPECNGPLANPEFVSRLPGSSVTHMTATSVRLDSNSPSRVDP